MSIQFAPGSDLSMGAAYMPPPNFGNWVTLGELLRRTNIRDVEKKPAIMMAAHALESFIVGPHGTAWPNFSLTGSENDRNAAFQLVLSAEPMMSQWGIVPDRSITTSQNYESYTDTQTQRYWSLDAIKKAFSDRGITLAYDPTRQKGNFYSTQSWSVQFGVLNAATGEVLHEFRVGEGSLGSAMWKGFILPAASILVGQYASAVGAFIAPTASAGTQAIVGSATISGANTALRGGDFGDVIESAIVGAAGGAAKPYIADAIDYVASLAPGQLADVAGAAEIAYQEQVGIDLGVAQAGAIYDFGLSEAASAAELLTPPVPVVPDLAIESAADAAALASEIQPATVHESLVDAEFLSELLAPVQTAPIVGPPDPSSGGSWGRRTSIFSRRASITGGSFESAESAAAIWGPSIDQVAFPTVDTVAPVIPAEVLPLTPPTIIESAPITTPDIIESVGSAVDNIEGDYDWLFGYSNPVADFSTQTPIPFEDSIGDFFEFNPIDLEGIDAGYIPTAQDVASNVGYVEAGSFQPVANTQATFDQIIRNVTVAAGTALTLVRAWREIDGPEPNTTAQARVGGSIVRANPDGTITSTNAAGQTIRTLPPKGQPQMTTDGSMIVNNGDGTYTRILPSGQTSVQRYGSAPAAASMFSGLSTPLLIGAGALLVFAAARSR
jgi:hypothetical protein